MRKVFLAVFLAMLLAVTAAAAQTAEDITNQCRITSPGKSTDNVHDGLYTSFWRNREMKNGYLEFETPAGKSARWLYICFGEDPQSWEIQTMEGGTWNTLMPGTYDFSHVVLDLGSQTHFRLIDTSGKSSQFKINEVFVFGDGELPEWVQQWQKPQEKADILLIVAHPDDELIFFGGTIPDYGVERGKNVVVAYMSYSNTTRKSELLNGLWSMGVKSYPIIGNFHDTYCSTLQDAYRRWKQTDVDAFITTLIRRFRPDVVLTHDVHGEYGHGAHKLCADAVLRCVDNAVLDSFYPDSALLYGTWQVKKVYLHLYAENQSFMNWNIPLESQGGLTGLQAAARAYKYHVTQQTTKFEVTDSGRTSCALFGLARTAVGPDIIGSDFLENIETAATAPAEDAAVQAEIIETEVKLEAVAVTAEVIDAQNNSTEAPVIPAEKDEDMVFPSGNNLAVNPSEVAPADDVEEPLIVFLTAEQEEPSEDTASDEANLWLELAASFEEPMLDEASPSEATAGEASPGEASPGEASPGEATPGEATAGEATPSEATIGEAIMEDTYWTFFSEDMDASSADAGQGVYMDGATPGEASLGLDWGEADSFQWDSVGLENAALLLPDGGSIENTWEWNETGNSQSEEDSLFDFGDVDEEAFLEDVELEQELGNKPYADVIWPVAKPELDALGYPLEGEIVYAEESFGIWFYASPSLVVRVDRIFDQANVLTWYEAQVFCDLERERFGSILYDPDKPYAKHVQARDIAKQNQVVFGMNTDYYTYRLGRKTMIGMVIRGGKVLFDRVPAANRSQFPNLDTLAMYEDGHWEVHLSDELTAAEYLSAGAVDVFSFGPYLIRGGEINPYVSKMSSGKTEQPRCAIGMIEPGHYFALLAEGRIRNVSVGVDIQFLVDHMYAAGCQEVLNLDGGQTAVMCFMGKQISRIAEYNGSTNPRPTTELMGIGHSDLVDPHAK